MDLFRALPSLRQVPFFEGKKVAVIGVSAVTRDGGATYFEIRKPKYWRCQGTPGEDPTIVGVGGIGGTIERGEKVLACLKREVKEELGVGVRLELPRQSFLIHDWQVSTALDIAPSRKYPIPLMVILTPPRLGGPDTPDHLAILSFLTQLKGEPAPYDLFGLLRIEEDALGAFFSRDEWPLEDVQALPGVGITLNDQLPCRSILRPVLTARAFQLLVRGGHEF